MLIERALNRQEVGKPADAAAVFVQHADDDDRHVVQRVGLVILDCLIQDKVRDFLRTGGIVIFNHGLDQHRNIDLGSVSQSGIVDAVGDERDDRAGFNVYFRDRGLDMLGKTDWLTVICPLDKIPALITVNRVRIIPADHNGARDEVDGNNVQFGLRLTAVSGEKMVGGCPNCRAVADAL